MITIGLIDDHVALTDAITLLLEQEEKNKVVKAVHNYNDGLNLIEENQCHVYIIDMNLGKEDSCELISAVNNKGRIPIVLSAYSDIAIIRKAVKAGAKSYLSKSSAARHIKTAIEKTTNGLRYYDEIIQDSINSLLDTNRELSTVQERALTSSLTKREKEILELISQEYTSAEIAQELHLSKHTVDGYRKNLISKLGVRSSIGLGKVKYSQ